MGWLGDLFYMNKALDQGIAKRGFANTNIRNQLKGQTSAIDYLEMMFYYS